MEEIVTALDACFGAMPGDVEFDAYSGPECPVSTSGLPLSPEVTSSAAKSSAPQGFPLPRHRLSCRTRGDIAAFRRSLNVAQDQHKAIIEAIFAREGFRAETVGAGACSSGTAQS